MSLSSEDFALFNAFITFFDEGISFGTHPLEYPGMTGVFCIALGEEFRRVGYCVRFIGLPVQSQVSAFFLSVNFSEGRSAALQPDVYGTVPYVG